MTEQTSRRPTGTVKRRVISPASLIMMICLVPVTFHFQGFSRQLSFNYIDALAKWVQFLLLFPSKKLVVNPIVRVSMTVATATVLVMVVLDLLYEGEKRWRKQEICIWIAMGLLVALPVMWTVTYRSVTGEWINCHDGGILQTEAAMEMLLNGKNPYTEDYLSFPDMLMYAKSHGVMEPLEHNPYLPASFILPIPLRWFWIHHLFGYYDQHIFYLLCYLVSLWLMRGMASGEDRLTLLAAVAFNPAGVWFLMEGRNDIVIFLLALFIVRYIDRSRPVCAGIFLGIALAFKQFAWLMLPFLWVYAGRENGFRHRRRIMGVTALMVCLGFIAPFLVWDAPSFYDDTFAFNTGRSVDAYLLGGTPGYGLSNFVLYWGLVPDRHAYFPFWIPMLLLGAPACIFLIMRQQRTNSKRFLFLSMGIMLFIIAFSSRFFHSNYIVLVSMFLTVAYFASEEKNAAIDNVPEKGSFGSG